mgnify:CR=1 FL=1
MSKVKILSIDGGGIRGILPGVVLTRLEEKLQIHTKDNDVKLADFFDLFAGTSTGGILTLSYLMPGDNNRPFLSAQEAVDLYWSQIRVQNPAILLQHFSNAKKSIHSHIWVQI